jgi:putative CocE/NonD family hydrolase
MRGKNRVEDVPTMIQKYLLINAYWEDKAAKLERIEVPAYIVASWTNMIHTHGTLEGFRRISSKDKWLRVHNTQEWPDYYALENIEELRRFFDRYLKGIENDWEKTPRVRLSVLDPGGVDEVNRPENDFPLARTDYQTLYLDANMGRLSPYPVAEESTIHYKADDSKGQAVFTFRFNQNTELTGYMKLRLWVQADGADDMDLFAFVQKLDKDGNFVPALVLGAPNFEATGRLRVSHRKLDPVRSTPAEPYLIHRVEELLSPGQVVPVEIAICPTGMLWHAGEKLCLIIAGHNLAPVAFPGIKPPKLRNKGEHIIHTGKKYDSHLLVPVILKSPSLGGV